MNNKENNAVELSDEELTEVTGGRKDLTGSVATVSGVELTKSPVQNITQTLQCRIAGVDMS